MDEEAEEKVDEKVEKKVEEKVDEKVDEKVEKLKEKSPEIVKKKPSYLLPPSITIEAPEAKKKSGLDLAITEEGESDIS